MTTTPKYRIRKSPSEELWLDGYNGGTEWEWTVNRKSAWQMSTSGADKNLIHVQRTFPDAFIEEVV